ncbi:carbohydrate-binding module family 43 protein/Glycoside hydrolase family 72 protein [Suillus ampliporus]|nr:carbohydrate-binding module family 43 protein/Glycoside hydrolase family 72 protein [Suillus ampliporus]
MRATSRFAAGLALAGAFLTGVDAIQAVSRNGRYLYTADGSRFYIKGVAYQEQGAVVATASNPFLEPSTFIDPLANGTACSRDLPYLQQLGVNTIRAYSVNSSLNHDSCMQTFSNAGIYTIIDLSLPGNGSIDRNSPSWTTNLLDLYIETISVFSKYNNVLAYNVGNEVIIAPGNATAAATFVKAAARDVKSYLNSIKSSALVGYASIDGDATWLDPLANYLSCDPSGSNSGAAAIDLFGLNNYEWCGNSTFQASYSGIEGQFAGYNVPAYFSEFGCITSPPRLWTEVGALFSTEMSPVWSGGVAFSYFPATSVQGQFGMVTISTDGSTVTTSSDFTSLQAQYAAVSPPTSPAQSTAGTTSYPSCPQQNSTWLAANTLPPTPNLAACQCLENNLSCQFTPTTSNYSAIVGSLLDYACSLIGQVGGNCNAIATNGTTGQYGAVSECDPTVMLSYVMSEYYVATGANAQSCSFGGNGTVNSKAPSSASGANSVASSCLASATSTSVPTLPAGASSASGSSSSSGGSGGSSTSAASVVLADARTLMGMGVLVVAGIASGLWTLA